MDEVQNQEEVKTEESTPQPAEGLMADAKIEEEQTTQDEGMATKSADQVAEGEDLDNVEFDRPDYFPEKFWDKKDGPDVEGIAKGYAELEKAFHKKNSKAPESYDLTSLTEKGFKDDDPLVETFSQWSKSNNISQESFEELASKFIEMSGQQAQAEEVSIQQEKQKLGQNADDIIKSNVRWGKSLVSKGILSQEDYQELEIWGGTAEGQRLLNKFRSMMGEREIPTVSVEGQKMDEDELKAMVGDPRYANDEAYRKKVERMFVEFYDKR